MSETDVTVVETTVPPQEPIHRLTFDVGPPRRAVLPNGTRTWLVTRYDDVHQVLTDPRFQRSLLHAEDAPPLAGAPNMPNNSEVLFNLDGADHLSLRRTVQRVFTPRGIERLRPWVAAVVDRLLDELVERGSPTDLVAGYALPLPLAVMKRLMGVEDLAYDRLRHWAEHAFSDASRDAADVSDAVGELFAFSAQLLTERRRSPGDDLISTLVQAAEQEGGLPEAHLAHLVGGLLVGGYDSTMTMLGNCLLYLLGERAEVWPRLGADEAAAAALTERLLHLIPLGRNAETPGILSRTAEDVELGGVTIPAGDVVAADTAAANRDPAAFGDDPFRDLFAPLERPTLALGGGRHYCLGAWLARSELHLALHKLAARLPALRLTADVSDVRWRPGTTLRSPLALPAAW